MEDSSSQKQFEDDELKHLELIEGVIERLARNSFLLKGWSVSLVAAILAFAARSPSIYLLVVALSPALVFWGLDAFYLGQERHFRDMYKDARDGNIPVLSIEPYAYESGFEGWKKSARSRSVWPLHAVVVLVVFVATITNWLSA